MLLLCISSLTHSQLTPHSSWGYVHYWMATGCNLQEMCAVTVLRNVVTVSVCLCVVCVCACVCVSCVCVCVRVRVHSHVSVHVFVCYLRTIHIHQACRFICQSTACCSDFSINITPQYQVCSHLLTTPNTWLTPPLRWYMYYNRHNRCRVIILFNYIIAVRSWEPIIYTVD